MKTKKMDMAVYNREHILKQLERQTGGKTDDA